MLQGWELHPQPLLGDINGTRGIRDAGHWTELWKTIPEAPLWGELMWQAMGSSCPQLHSPCVAPCYLLGTSASSCPGSSCCYELVLGTVSALGPLLSEMKSL